MPTKTLIELNHDYAERLKGEAIDLLVAYLRNPESADREFQVEELEYYGIRVIGTQHSYSVRTLGYRSPYHRGHTKLVHTDD